MFIFANRLEYGIGAVAFGEVGTVFFAQGGEERIAAFFPDFAISITLPAIKTFGVVLALLGLLIAPDSLFPTISPREVVRAVRYLDCGKFGQKTLRFVDGSS